MFVHVYVCVGCVPVSVCAVCVCDVCVCDVCVCVVCGSCDVYFCVLDGVHLCTFSVLGLLVLEHAGVELCVVPVVETSAGHCGWHCEKGTNVLVMSVLGLVVDCRARRLDDCSELEQVAEEGCAKRRSSIVS